MARCAEKNARATWWMSALHVACTKIAIACERNLRKKKSLSLAHVAPLRPLQIFCSDATFCQFEYDHGSSALPPLVLSPATFLPFVTVPPIV